MKATVSKPTPYQAKYNDTKHEIVVSGFTSLEQFLAKKMVRRILRQAKKWDKRATKYQWRVMIREAIPKADLELWLYRNFPETNPARVPRPEAIA